MFQWTTALTSEQTDSRFKLSTNPRIAIAGLCVISMPELTGNLFPKKGREGHELTAFPFLNPLLIASQKIYWEREFRLN